MSGLSPHNPMKRRPGTAIANPMAAASLGLQFQPICEADSMLGALRGLATLRSETAGRGPNKAGQGLLSSPDRCKVNPSRQSSVAVQPWSSTKTPRL